MGVFRERAATCDSVVSEFLGADDEEDEEEGGDTDAQKVRACLVGGARAYAHAGECVLALTLANAHYPQDEAKQSSSAPHGAGAGTAPAEKHASSSRASAAAERRRTYHLSKSGLRRALFRFSAGYLLAIGAFSFVLWFSEMAAIEAEGLETDTLLSGRRHVAVRTTHLTVRELLATVSVFDMSALVLGSARSHIPSDTLTASSHRLIWRHICRPWQRMPWPRPLTWTASLCTAPRSAIPKGCSAPRCTPISCA